MRLLPFRLLMLLIAVSWIDQVIAQDDSRMTSRKEIDRRYDDELLPLLRRYCFECHSGDDAEADIDLAGFPNSRFLRRQIKVWQKVGSILKSGQMPPKDSRQLSDVDSRRLHGWVRDFLSFEAKANAGDPGPVVLRRLNNAEFTYTIRDLTGINSIDPTKEFPVDGAAGEGFTNTGAALVMSPSLVAKYLDAAKKIAQHTVLLPDGFRFSSYTTQRDWTDEALAKIQDFYDRYTDGGGGNTVVVQGLKFDTNQGGLLPLEKYFSALTASRAQLLRGQTTLSNVANDYQLSVKYLQILWEALTTEANDDHFLLGEMKEKWAASAQNVPSLINEIRAWQNVLWKYNHVGHIGRSRGPTSWMEPISPIVTSQTFRFDVSSKRRGSASDVVVYLAATSLAKDGTDRYVVWKNPRLESDILPPISIRDVVGVQQSISDLRTEALSKTAQYLAATTELNGDSNLTLLAEKHALDEQALHVWSDFLRLDHSGEVTVTGHFTQRLRSIQNYDFVNGWGTNATPFIAANSSRQTVNIPGTLSGRTVVGHPTPSVFVAAGWLSPIDGIVSVESLVADAHIGCGNGLEWAVQHRSGNRVSNLWHSAASDRKRHQMQPKTLSIRKGELISFILGPRDGNHACDLTEFNLVISEKDGAKRVWNLTNDVSANILKGNPHPDQHGFSDTWHFYKGLVADVFKASNRPIAIPAGSVLAKWQEEKDAGRRADLARKIQQLAVGPAPQDSATPDAILYHQLQAMLNDIDPQWLLTGATPDPRFGKHPLGGDVDSRDLFAKEGEVVEIRIPAPLAKGRTFVVTGEVDALHSRESGMQLQATLEKKPVFGSTDPRLPILVSPNSKTQRQLESSFDQFRELFPVALCYARIVPIDEAVTLTLYYREDQRLQDLLLSPSEIEQLDRLWEELRFISHEPLRYFDAFEQIREFATQDRPDLVEEWKPLVKPVTDRAVAFRKRLIDAEPDQLSSVLDFAERAWRRNLTTTERARLAATYESLRNSKMLHDDAIRLTIARVLVSPAFLFRTETPGPETAPRQVNDFELANRLSYFLWSSMPDRELRILAENKKLSNDEILRSQTMRMLKDPRARRMAIHFACQWLHVRDFDQNDGKNERRYPTFVSMRRHMNEETVRFFEHLIRDNGSILHIFDADHTFLNEPLALT